MEYSQLYVDAVYSVGQYIDYQGGLHNSFFRINICYHFRQPVTIAKFDQAIDLLGPLLLNGLILIKERVTNYTHYEGWDGTICSPCRLRMAR